VCSNVCIRLCSKFLDMLFACRHISGQVCNTAPSLLDLYTPRRSEVRGFCLPRFCGSSILQSERDRQAQRDWRPTRRLDCQFVTQFRASGGFCSLRNGRIFAFFYFFEATSIFHTFLWTWSTRPCRTENLPVYLLRLCITESRCTSMYFH
jgi:hypothetical protein